MKKLNIFKKVKPSKWEKAVFKKLLDEVEVIPMFNFIGFNEPKYVIYLNIEYCKNRIVHKYNKEVVNFNIPDASNIEYLSFNLKRPFFSIQNLYSNIKNPFFLIKYVRKDNKIYFYNDVLGENHYLFSIRVKRKKVNKLINILNKKVPKPIKQIKIKKRHLNSEFYRRYIKYRSLFH